jgi:hypothetical protein
MCLVCVLAIAFIGFVQVVHVHDNAKTFSHDCSICAVAHSGVLPRATYQPTPVFVPTCVVAQRLQSKESSEFFFTLHIRPPPSV